MPHAIIVLIFVLLLHPVILIDNRTSNRVSQDIRSIDRSRGTEIDALWILSTSIPWPNSHFIIQLCSTAVCCQKLLSLDQVPQQLCWSIVHVVQVIFSTYSSARDSVNISKASQASKKCTSK